MWKRFFSKKILLQEIMRDTSFDFSDWIPAFAGMTLREDDYKKYSLLII
jgi:hypothetical protein